MEQPRTLVGPPCRGADRGWTSPRVADSRGSARFPCVREGFRVCSARSWEPGEVARFSAARRVRPGSFVPRRGVAPASRRSPHAAGGRPAPLSSDRAPGGHRWRLRGAPPGLPAPSLCGRSPPAARAGAGGGPAQRPPSAGPSLLSLRPTLSLLKQVIQLPRFRRGEMHSSCRNAFFVSHL